MIEEAGWHPHPVRGPRAQLRFRLSGPADELRVKIYLPSMILASEQALAGTWKPGWNSAQVDLLGLPAGLCYGVLEARQAGRRSLNPRTLRLLRLP